MREIELGRTGLTVSAVGFGGIPIQRLSDQEAVSVVCACLDLGVTFIDTASGYTTSEERIGRAITGRREGLVLATKTGAREARGVRQDLALSLERLGVDTIDLYQFHCVSSDEDYQKVVARGGPLDAVREAQASGHVRHVGLTSHSMQVALRAVQSGHFETIMFPFNLVANEAAEELIPLALELEVGFIAMKPLAGGALDDATLAFRYLQQFPGILPIPGIEHAAEMEEIISVMEDETKMTPDERERVARLHLEMGTRFCRRCGYCQPCPEGVSLQSLMILDSILKRMPADHVFSNLSDSVDSAAACCDCGECEDKCPYNLPIREIIKEHVDLFHAEMARLGLI
jgi:predicted aldo/keto reductase-like oxidoreductase